MRRTAYFFFGFAFGVKAIGAASVVASHSGWLQFGQELYAAAFLFASIFLIARAVCMKA